jgi:malonate decarboxylase delta subunit
MEKLKFEFSGGAHRDIRRDTVLVGVVASGNLEILMERAALNGACKVEIHTAAIGFGEIWKAVLNDFFERHFLSDVRISINDVGATPAVVSVRLDQAVEELLEKQA